MSNYYLSKSEARAEIEDLGSRYLTPEDIEYVLNIFDTNSSGKHILYILSTKKKSPFSEKDAIRIKVLAQNLGV